MLDKLAQLNDVIQMRISEIFASAHMPTDAGQLVFFVIPILAFIAAVTVGWTIWPDEARRNIRKRFKVEFGSGEEAMVMHQFQVMLNPLHRLLPISGYLNWLRGFIARAGFQFPPIHIVIMQEFGVIAATILYVYLRTMDVISGTNVGVICIFLTIGGSTPLLWLNTQIKARRLTVSRDLPEVVDLLALCVSAGADFMKAMGRIVREFRPCPVRDELAIVLSEVRVGQRRRDALRGFAERLQTPAASTFARTLIQADRMGTGLIDALSVLSEDMRMERYAWAERFASAAPMKMLLPLIVSLGSALVIVAGPIFVQFIRGGIGIAGANAIGGG